MYTWYVDPIDNTAGVLSGEVEISTSVALKKRDEHIRALVVNLRTGDSYEASTLGALKNGCPIVSFGGNLSDRIRPVSTCAFVRPSRIHALTEILAALFKHRYPVRVTGGAALDLCHVADGSRAAHISTGAHLWDVEAGFHLVELAGGHVEILSQSNNDFTVAFIAAANKNIYGELQHLLEDCPEFTTIRDE
jgi:myo-inositol-1(or 4)-monophosphatase